MGTQLGTSSRPALHGSQAQPGPRGTTVGRLGRGHALGRDGRTGWGATPPSVPITCPPGGWRGVASREGWPGYVTGFLSPRIRKPAQSPEPRPAGPLPLRKDWRAHVVALHLGTGPFFEESLRLRQAVGRTGCVRGYGWLARRRSGVSGVGDPGQRSGTNSNRGLRSIHAARGVRCGRGGPVIGPQDCSLPSVM